MSFNGLLPNFEIMQVPTIAQCMISVDVANQLRDDAEWSHEVKAYLRAVFRHDSLFYALPPLDFVEPDVEGFNVQVEDIKKRWPTVRDSGVAPTEDTIEGEQLRHLLLIQRVLNEHRAMLRAQLPLVEHV
jgi:hypothetical protein